MRRLIILLFLLSIPMLSIAEDNNAETKAEASADQRIFTWIDENGVVHYGSKPSEKTKNSKEAKLPTITKTKHSVPKGMSVSCAGHGGVDCSRGADTDGSVICTDGFKHATTRYLFHCNDTRLAVQSISELNSTTGNFSVFIRNMESADAKGITVSYSFPNNQEDVALSGPKKLKAYEVGEYLLEGIYFVDQSMPNDKSVKISCTNCR